MGARNVIFITSDQQQVGAMGCADPSFITPHLDALADRGVRFTRTMTTAAQCTPARASWETGRYPHEVGVNQIGHAIRAELTMVAKEFARAGYETAHFGKWHLFTPQSLCGYQVTDYRMAEIDLEQANTAQLEHRSVCDAEATAKAVHYIRDMNERPFFMVLSYHCPHPGDSDFELIEAFRHLYPLEEMPMPHSFYADDLSTKPAFQKERADSPECSLTEEKIRIDAQKYRTLVSFLDWNVGRVLDELGQKGMFQDTAIVFSSDHGDLQGAHRLRLKGVVPYRELYQVPLIVVNPSDTGGGRVSDRLVSSAAVPGTLLSLAGLPVPEDFSGGVLPDVLQGVQGVQGVQGSQGVLQGAANGDSPWDEPSPDKECVFFEHYKAYWGFHPFYGVQTSSWKYVYYYRENLEEMYDLARDPDELVNVAVNPDVGEIKERLRSQVSSWWEQTGALSVTPVKATDVDGVWGSLGNV